MIYTSYFANPKLKKVDPDRLIAISIGIPQGFKGKRMLELAPTWEMVSWAKNKELDKYVNAYIALLGKLDVKEIIRQIPDNSVLLCYEKLPNFCHRHLALWWLMMNNVEIREYEF